MPENYGGYLRRIIKHESFKVKPPETVSIEGQGYDDKGEPREIQIPAPPVYEPHTALEKRLDRDARLRCVIAIGKEVIYSKSLSQRRKLRLLYILFNPMSDSSKLKTKALADTLGCSIASVDKDISKLKTIRENVISKMIGGS